MSSPGSSPLARARCLVHPDREAVGKCPDCGHFFCRECLIEHEGKMTCARCLAETVASEEMTASRFRFVSLLHSAFSWGLALLSVGVAWGFFYTLGRILIFLRHEWQELLL